MFRIGEFSKMTMTTVKALRYYDETGVLRPEFTDPFTGYRFYTTRQLVQLHKIHALRQGGLSIEEIKLLTLGEQNPRAILERRQAELLCEFAEKQRQLSQIEFILQRQEEDIFMNYAATIKELPGCTIYSKQMTVPSYDSYFQLIPAIGEALSKKYPDLKCRVPEYCFIRYLDGEYKEKDINVEYCEAVDSPRPDFDDIKFRQIEAATAVSVLHKGSYNELPKAYAYAFRWMEENGYTAADAPRECYIDGIWNKEDPSEWLTDLQIPIVKITAGL